MPSGFFAYPSQPADIGTVVRSALDILQKELGNPDFVGWEENEIAGRFITQPILARIAEGDVLAADITKLNFNVIYEIGYAVGLQKRVYLTKSGALTSDDQLVREVGIFDTLGYNTYTTSKQLATGLSNLSDLKPLPFDADDVNRNAPVYVLLPKLKTDLELRLTSRIKKSRLYYRSFDPVEHGRLSAGDVIKQTAMSYGVVIPLLSSNRNDGQAHNLRAAFLAGLTAGMEKELFLFQLGFDPIPLDYRDLVHQLTAINQIDEHVGEFATSITDRFQSRTRRLVSEPRDFLARLNLGASSAENEMGELGDYYLETEEYRRASRGEAQIVAGRKGSGKTALFFKLRDTVRRHKHNIVLDLKPEGYQLLKLKDVILIHLERGTKEHTVTAFWEYLLLLEICHKILEKDREPHITNHELFVPYRELAAGYQSDAYVSEGDFAERLAKLTERIVEDFQNTIVDGAAAASLTNAEVTNILYKHDTRALRAKLVSYLGKKRSLWILFDNLDKGWPAKGISEDDILIIRCLIDAVGKMTKYLRKGGTDSFGIVFLRNDVYEQLLEHTSDRGKTSRVSVDWTDPDLLRELIHKRLITNGVNPNSQFDDIWREICASHVGVEDSANYMIDRCLMRPRSLIDFLQFCKSHAVNLRHKKITVDDIKKGEEAYSSDLVATFSLEIRDVYPDAGEVLYAFIGCSAKLSHDDVVRLLKDAKVSTDNQEQLVELLLWYGFFGALRSNGEVAYIYNVNYDMRRLRAILGKSVHGGHMYFINPAFWVGLEIVS